MAPVKTADAPVTDQLVQAEQAAADEIASIEAELAELPARAEAALLEGDAQTLALSQAQQQILERRLVAARDEHRVAQLAIATAVTDRLKAQYDELSDRVAEYELAADAYARTAKTMREGELRSLHNQLTRAEHRRQELRAPR